MSMTSQSQVSVSMNDFDEARLRSLLDGLRALLGRRKNTLVPFDTIRQRLGATTESYRGRQFIPVDKIVGSENRYQDFSINFRPKKDLSRHRWARLDAAYKSLENLPPIVVYEIGGLYFVRDGNHRVSVAKNQKITHIDAEVHSLDSELVLSKDMSQGEMIEAIARHEMDGFFAASNLPRELAERELRFGKDKRYDLLVGDIERHLAYLQDEGNKSITFQEAAASWYHELFKPFAEQALKAGVIIHRKKIYPADLYAWWIKYEERIERELSACVMPDDFLEDQASHHQ